MSKKVRKPKDIRLYGVQVEASFLYTSKDVKKLRKWLEKAEGWIKNKENKLGITKDIMK